MERSYALIVTLNEAKAKEWSDTDIPAAYAVITFLSSKEDRTLQAVQAAVTTRDVFSCRSQIRFTRSNENRQYVESTTYSSVPSMQLIRHLICKLESSSPIRGEKHDIALKLEAFSKSVIDSDEFEARDIRVVRLDPLPDFNTSVIVWRACQPEY